MVGSTKLRGRVTPPFPLTDAESAVLALVLAGLKNADIARSRATSPRTVAHQIARILNKYGAASRRELLAILAQPEADAAHGPSGEKLTERERQVFALATAGKANKLIASELNISIGTVGVLLWRASRTRAM